ncbi:serine hydrolase domain-containing protein [Legionella fallonii]|uniref:Putative (Serine-type) D-alanyl-D-alanine carboxypeptidase n=1 Tax=Legionella fallonii LLAP-10 TaxID=1212491 RepID=A0A098GAY7_9GAMM|nr:serine hydrolase domain-containing protein [Legionella fallonii]CEG58645.1 putative (Serine-type) D-alanyl-D-alanine carboxypeptidase [Legionella fallonii LLAP-10]
MVRFNRLVIIVFFLISTALTANNTTRHLNQNKLKNLTDSYLKRYHSREHISAVTLTIDNGKERTTQYSGNTDFFKFHPVDSSNLYQAGSIAKSFIAAVILQLEATPELHFNIDDKLSKYLPQYTEWGDISVKQLLNMTSGIPDYLEDSNYLQDLANNPHKQWLSEEKLSYVMNKPLLFAPGTKWNYSNTNYILAGLIITKLTGNSVAEELNERFLAPNNPYRLHLQNTFYVSHQYPEYVIPRMVHGYFFGGTSEQFIPYETDITDYSLSYAEPAGAIVSNSEDITQWVRALLTPNRVLTQKQLSELTTLVSTITGQPLTTPNRDNPNGFGLGIGLSYMEPKFPGLIFNYEGMTIGYRAQYIYIPKENIIISATTNSSVNPDNDHLIELISDAYDALSK